MNLQACFLAVTFLLFFCETLAHLFFSALLCKPLFLGLWTNTLRVSGLELSISLAGLVCQLGNLGNFRCFGQSRLFLNR